jgi:DNA polymerase III subunit chi
VTAEIWFYELAREPVDRVLPGLLYRHAKRGDTVYVWCGSKPVAEELSTKLWGIEDVAFVPHAIEGEGEAPIMFGFDPEPGKDAAFHYAIEGNMPEAVSTASRVSIMFDAMSEAQRDAARSAWKRFKSLGHEVKFWKQDANNRWEDQAAKA